MNSLLKNRQKSELKINTIMDSSKKVTTFIWFLDNYSYCSQKNEETLFSPSFTADWLEGTEWNLRLCPRGRRVEDKGHISLFMVRNEEDSGPESVPIKYELSLLAANGSPLESADYDYTFKKGEGFGRPKFVEMAEVLSHKKADYLPQDTLTVRCRMWQGEGKVRNVAHVCARSRIGVEKISFLFEVEDFINLKPNQKNTIEIPSRSKGVCFGLSSLFFTKDSSNDGEVIVEITPSNVSHILSKRKISLIDVHGNVIGCGEGDNLEDPMRRDIQNMPLSLTRGMILNNKREYLPGGKLSLLCECFFSTGLEIEKNGEFEREMSVPFVPQQSNPVQMSSVDVTDGRLYTSPSVSEDMKTLYLNQSLTDIRVKTENKVFPAHKNVLCARSPVLKTKILNNMEEKSICCIQIDDLSEDVVSHLLLFLYSDTVENLDMDLASKLYDAADKYEVSKLKEVCSSFFVKNLTPANAVELLLLADTQSDEGLKRGVGDFILEHESEVFVSEEWKNLMKMNHLLVMEIMELKYKGRSEEQ